MQINYKYLNIYNYDKTYVISDIHGDIDIFKMFIDKIDIKSNILLIINGDIFEKGQHSLKLIKEIISLSKVMNIEIVLGNNDTIFNEWGPYYNDDNILRYLSGVKNSILIDMANELKLPYSNSQEVHILHQSIIKHYQYIIDYLKDAPHILETEEYIFVHAGIENKDYKSQTYEYLLTAKAFANEINTFNKTIIVGHWPTSNYSNKIIKINPYFNRNVISIDGGISLKDWSQLNYLIIDKTSIKYDYIDNLSQIKILDDQKDDEDYYSLIYPKTKCKILEKYDNNYLVYLEYINKNITIDKERIYHYRGNDYILDYTNYHMKLNKNDIVSFIKEVDDEIMIKKDGIISLYKGPYEYIKS